MKASIFYFLLSFVVTILVATNLTGRTQTDSKSNFTVPATIVNGDTLPVVNIPVVVINGEKKNYVVFVTK